MDIEVSNWQNVSSPRHWLDLKHKVCSPGQLSIIAYGIEYLWNTRNKIVYNDRTTNFELEWQKVKERLERFKEATVATFHSSKSNSPSIPWSPPPTGLLKVNVDASPGNGDGVGW